MLHVYVFGESLAERRGAMRTEGEGIERDEWGTSCELGES
jgi:hypothetical protein